MTYLVKKLLATHSTDSICYYIFMSVVFTLTETNTIRRKILTGKNIDVFDEFPAICQYFPYPTFPFSQLLTADEFVAIWLRSK